MEGEAAPADTSEVIIRSVRGSGNCRLISALATPPAPPLLCSYFQRLTPRYFILYRQMEVPYLKRAASVVPLRRRVTLTGFC